MKYLGYYPKQGHLSTTEDQKLLGYTLFSKKFILSKLKPQNRHFYYIKDLSNRTYPDFILYFKEQLTEEDKNLESIKSKIKGYININLLIQVFKQVKEDKIYLILGDDRSDTERNLVLGPLDDTIVTGFIKTVKEHTGYLSLEPKIKRI